MTRVYNQSRHKRRRQSLRNNMPNAEVLLWCQLKNRQLKGYKFRRQHSVGPYIIDFYCPELKIAVEIDGDSHFKKGAKARDEKRDEYLESFGIRVKRFLNSDITENIDGALEVLWETIQELQAEGELRDPP